MKHLISRVSVTVGLPVLISLLVLATAGAIISITLESAQSSARTLALQNLRQIHDRINDRLTDVFEIPERLSRVNAHLIKQGVLDWATPRRWRTAFYEQISAFDSVSAIIWADESGRSAAVLRYPGTKGYVHVIGDEATGFALHEYTMDMLGQLSADPSKIYYSYDPHRRPWYVMARSAGTAGWTDVYTWAVQQDAGLILSNGFATPVYEDAGELLGVMNVEFNLYDIGHFLGELPIGLTGMAFIMDQNGNLVATSDNSRVLQPASGDRVAAHASESRLIAATAGKLETVRQGEGGQLQQRHYDLNFADETFLITESPFARSGQLQWRVVTVVPELDFLGEILAGRRQAYLIMVVAVISALLLGVGIARYLSHPIVRLTEHALQIGSGELNNEVQLNEFSEFTRLSASINRMTHGLRERLSLKQSLELAKEVQQSLLPSTTPMVPGLDLVGHSHYCDQTGGDYFDFVQMPDQGPDSVVIAIGDVSGHGIASAMIMASARGILRSRSREASTLAGLLNHVNAQIAEDTSGGRYMTMLLASINTRTGILRWASAGHREPILYDPTTDDFPELNGGDMPLGVTEEITYSEFRFAGLRPGQVMLLATDGLWETSNGEGQLFGMDRVRSVLRQHAQFGSAQIRNALIAEMADFRGATVQGDDITFVVATLVSTAPAESGGSIPI